jgi:predicted nucleic acid-binding Zn ribbon protein
MLAVFRAARQYSQALEEKERRDRTRGFLLMLLLAFLLLISLVAYELH